MAARYKGNRDAYNVKIKKVFLVAWNAKAEADALESKDKGETAF